MAIFKTICDQSAFINKRVIAANVQGLAGKKVDHTSIPHSKVQIFSVETTGTLDLGCEIDFFINTGDRVRCAIRAGFDVVSFHRIISEYTLK